jgi:hypothetical protein
MNNLHQELAPISDAAWAQRGLAVKAASLQADSR